MEPRTIPPSGEPSLPAPADDSVADLPPGSHAVEVAARAGFGPLSPVGSRVWHGDAKPCVSCGQLVRRGGLECEHCGQDLGSAMLDKMRAHAGPWYVLEHVRPFPGVSLERLIRQIRRGLLTATTIVRGPTTDHQWRFAVETPGLSRYFGRCWNCYGEVVSADTNCSSCRSHLFFETPPVSPTPRRAPAATPPAHTVASATPATTSRPRDPAADTPDGPKPSPELRKLTAAVSQVDLPAHDSVWDDPPRLGGIRATWIVAAILVALIIALMIFTGDDSKDKRPEQAATPRAAQAAP